MGKDAEDKVISNNWNRTISHILWGIFLSIVKFDFAWFGILTSFIGVLLIFTGFRSLRKENKYFKFGYIFSGIGLFIHIVNVIFIAAAISRFMTDSIIFKSITIIAVCLQFFTFVFLYKGISQLRKDYNLEPRVKGGILLIFSYILFFIIVISQVEIIGIFIILLMIFIFSLIFIGKNAKELSSTAYRLNPYDEKISAFKLGNIIAIITLIFIVSVRLGASTLPMDFVAYDWTYHDADDMDEISDDIAHMLDIGFPKEILEDMTFFDILAVAKAEEVYIAKGNITGDLQVTTVLSRLNDGLMWNVVQYFDWTKTPEFKGNEAIIITLDNNTNIPLKLNTSFLNGLCIYDCSLEEKSNRNRYAASFYDLRIGTISNTPSYDFFQNNFDLGKTITASFSFPEFAKHPRGYISYNVFFNEVDRRFFTSSIMYAHQVNISSYPVRVAGEREGSTFIFGNTFRRTSLMQSIDFEDFKKIEK